LFGFLEAGSSHVITTLLASCDVFCFPLVYLITIPCFLREHTDSCLVSGACSLYSGRC
jgi:hypothetical protein